MTIRAALLFAAFFFSAAAAGGGESGHGGAHGAHGELPAMQAIPGASIYQLESVWRDADDGETTLAALAGKPVVAAMIYSSCEYACPLIVGDMMKIYRGLGEARGDARFVLFSFDPARDNPRRLADYRRRNNLPAPDWTLLTAPDDAVQELAVALGVRYRKAGDEFNHSNLVTILDRDGTPVFRQVGLNLPPDDALAALRELL